MKRKTQSKNLILIFALILTFLITGCGKADPETAFTLNDGQTDSDYVMSKGKLVVGITDYAPMDFKEGDNWIGFDAILAEQFAESLGVTAEFVEIDWDRKVKLLEQGAIDCIWNGMTMTEDLQSTISCSEPYLNNAQVVVLKTEKLEKYSTLNDCQHLLFAVENGSVGENLMKDNNFRYKTFGNQLEALQSVSDKKTDAAVIDMIMASYLTTEEPSLQDLGFCLHLNDEQFCIGFRKDSDLTQYANDFLKKAYDTGVIQKIAEEYGLQEALGF